MKRIRTVNGVKEITYYNEIEMVQKIREVISAHRETLITRLVSDLAVYIDYKFHAKPDTKDLENIKEKLYSLKNTLVHQDEYPNIFNDCLTQEVTYINSSPFYQEIDERIKYVLA
jgi:hypothetical protein